MTSKFCTKCGREVVAGKRFCGGCGQVLSTVSIPAQSEPVVIPEPEVIVCKNCGTALAPGKRFCKQCGSAIDLVAPVAPVAVVSSGQDASPTQDASVVDLSPIVPVAVPDLCMTAPAQNESSPVPGSSALNKEPDSTFSAEAEMVTAWTPALDQAEAGSALQQPSSAANGSPSSPESLMESQGESKTKIGLIIGIAAVVLVLVAAGGGWAWHVYSHRSAPSAVNTPNGQYPPTVTSPVPSAGATPTTQQPLKPSAGTAENLGTGSPHTQSGSVAATSSQHSSTNASENSTQGLAAVVPSASTMPPPPSPPVPTPATPRSGTLHYQGPPVPHNGEVVFDHLPHARLRFTFDHQAWSLTIKPNLDGTKKVTLISQAPGTQTSCDLGWEIIE